MSAGEQDMANTTTADEILDLEREYWQAIQNRDIETVLRLTDEPCTVTGAQGVGTCDREKIAAMFRAATYTLHRFELSKDAQVRLLDKDVAVVAYKVHEELTVDGNQVTLDAADSSTWVRRNGRWVCTLHTEAIMGDPFGRDRHSPEGAETSPATQTVEAGPRRRTDRA